MLRTDGSDSSSSNSDAEEPLIGDETENSVQSSRLSTVLQKSEAELNTALLESIEVKDAVWARSCLAKGANTDATCKELFVSAVHLAAFSGDAEILDYILNKNPHLSVKGDTKGRTPLHFSAWNGHDECIEIVIKYIHICKELAESDYINSNYGNVEASVTNFCDSSHSCSSITNHIDMVWNGCTALHLACARLQLNCVNVLLQHGAKTDITEVNYGLTPFEYCGKTYKENWSEASSDSLYGIIELISCYGNRNNVNWQVQRQGERRSRPLHVAVSLNSRKCIKLLLGLGCDPKALDENGQSAIHLAVDIRRIPPLKILANWSSTRFNNIVETPNANGLTPLQYAIKAEWLDGVRILLGAKANLIAQDANKETPLHMAARTGNLEIVDLIISKLPEKRKWLDAKNSKGESPLLVSILNGFEKCVRCFIQEGASYISTSKGFNVLHQAVETDNFNVMDALLEVDSSKLLLNEFDKENGMTPLHWAAYKNKPIYVQKLIEKGADPTLKTLFKGSTFDGFTALHIAANEGHDQVIKILLEKYPYLIDEQDASGWLPFHRAVYNCHRDCITIFLEKGCNFSENVPISPKEKKPVIKMLTNNMPRFADYLNDIFDSCIRVNEFDLNQPNCEVTLDYRMILPKQKTNRLDQMNVAVALFTSGKKYEYNKLLLHPFIESFLFFKWTRLKPFFFAMMALYFIFVILLTTTALSLYHDEMFQKLETMETNSTNSSLPRTDDNLIPYKIHNLILIGMLVMSITFIAIQEILFIRIKKLSYFLRAESWIKSCSIILGLIVVGVEMGNSSRVWSKYVTAIALLLSWMEIVILLSRFPEFGYYFQMFSTVALRGLKVFALFGFFMIFGFTLVFFLLYNTKSSFINIWDSFMKTAIMMTSEFDYSNMFDEDNWSFRHSLDQIFFLIFVFFVPIVTANLLSALAVSDIKDLEIEGKIQRLEEQVDFLGTHEILVYNLMKIFFHQDVIQKWRVEEQIVLYPGSPKWKKLYLIPHHIVQSIYDNLNLRKKEKERELRYEDVVSNLDELKIELKSLKEAILWYKKTNIDV